MIFWEQGIYPMGSDRARAVESIQLLDLESASHSTSRAAVKPTLEYIGMGKGNTGIQCLLCTKATVGVNNCRVLLQVRKLCW